jgi:hypothetical protein
VVHLQLLVYFQHSRAALAAWQTIQQADFPGQTDFRYYVIYNIFMAELVVVQVASELPAQQQILEAAAVLEVMGVVAEVVELDFRVLAVVPAAAAVMA